MPISDNLDQYVVTTEIVQDIFIPQQEKINVFNNTNYSVAPNAVKLLPVITNNNGKIKLYTEINSNIKVGDKVFIMKNIYGSTGNTDGIILDNFLEFSGCTDYIYLPQLQGYKVLETNEKNNEITIDRYYDSRFVNKKIYDHYISEIYIKNITISGGEIDGSEIEYANFNNALDTQIDINLVQAVVFSGVSWYMRLKDKYDNEYITTNSSINTGTTAAVYKPYIYKGADPLNQDPTPVSSYYSNNNNNYGYNYIYNNHLYNCQLDNGYYDNCILTDCTINGGLYTNCQIYSCIINGGIFKDSPIDSNSYWFYGTWSGGTFTQDIWYNGIWNGGSFIGKEWRNGIFNNGIFSGSTWRTGIFQGGTMDNSIWSGGTFSGGEIKNSNWGDGKFNGGKMTQCNWYGGSCNGGSLLNTIWSNGTFNDGSFSNGSWYNGTFNGGSIYNSYWAEGTFNGGKFNSNNSIVSISGGTVSYSNGAKYWKSGTFNGGTFTNSLWSGGTFNDGNFTDNSLWSGGTFNYGNFTNSNWLGGTFANGSVTNSYFHSVEWVKGIWNSGHIGLTLDTIGATVNWSGGTFNNGIFGVSDKTTIVSWYNGDFYNGDFYTGYVDCVAGPWYGGFSGGTFHDGNFYGVFWNGVWVTGNFAGTGCNKTNILTNSSIQTKYINSRIITRKYGELPLKSPQQMSNI